MFIQRNENKIENPWFNYLIGFNNEPGNNNAIADPFNINRTCVDSNDINLLKFNSCF